MSSGSSQRAPMKRQILVAGVGNAWLQDDGFGGVVAQRLDERELPPGVTVLDFGTGGLDLAYEVMRGYDALVLVDVSRQGGEPGTLYVIEPEPDELEPIEDGQVVNPHGMDPQTVLRFVKIGRRLAGQGGGRRLRAGGRRGDGAGALARGRSARSSARSTLVLETVAELSTDAAYEELS